MAATVSEPPKTDIPQHPAKSENGPSTRLVAEVSNGEIPQPLGSASPLEIVPSLCTLPTSRDLASAVSHGYEVIGKPAQDYAKAAKTLGSWATSVRQTLGVKRIAITGLGPSIGFDTTAACAALARTLIAQGAKTIVLDLAGSGEAFAHVFGLRPQAGLADLLSGQAGFEAVIARDMASEAHVISAGKNAGGASEITAGGRFAQALNALESVYDQILLDCGGLTLSTMPAVESAQAVLLLASGDQAAEAGRKLHELRSKGILAAQYVRLGDSSQVEAYQAA